MTTAELSPGRTDALASTLRESFANGAELGWMSHDPFDLLLSPALDGAVRWPLFARLAVQVGKRTGARTRRLLRVPVHEEAKTLSDHLQAAVLLVGAGQRWPFGYLAPLSRRLRDRAVVSDRGLGWGLEFPYASRFANAAARTPNLYVTTEAGHALLSLHELTGDPAAVRAARAGCRFVVQGLGTFVHGRHVWLRYWPGRDDPIVNVQASAAALLARAGACFDEVRLLELADSLALTVLFSQRTDGSWPYSVDDRAPFVDGFHTGFVLEGLRGYGRARGDAASSRVSDATAAGFGFFKRHLVTADGRPRAVADGPQSSDGQTVAQCVQTLVTCAEGPDDLRTAVRVWEWGLAAEQPRFPALRWTEGPRALAASHLLCALSEAEAGRVPVLKARV
jgi:hypothetical protein